jgi:hypothetical protein
MSPGPAEAVPSEVPGYPCANDTCTSGEDRVREANRMDDVGGGPIVARSAKAAASEGRRDVTRAPRVLGCRRGTSE